MKYREKLVELVLNNDELMEILKLVRSMELKEWAIGAGILRDLVWHKLNHVDKLDYRDIDVAYFDLDGMIGEEAEVERKLSEAMPDVPWDVKNQANVHHWYEGKFGFKVKPLDSITEAVSTWPKMEVIKSYKQ